MLLNVYVVIVTETWLSTLPSELQWWPTLQTSVIGIWEGMMISVGENEGVCEGEIDNETEGEYKGEIEWLNDGERDGVFIARTK